MKVMNVVCQYDRSVYGIKLLLRCDDLITINSKVNKQIVKKLSFESMELTDVAIYIRYDRVNHRL